MLKFLMEHDAETPETLRRLLNRGTREVIIVEALEKAGRDFGISTRWIVLGNLRRLGVEIITGAKITGVKQEGVSIEKKGAPSTVLLPADTVVIALGARPPVISMPNWKAASLRYTGSAMPSARASSPKRSGRATKWAENCRSVAPG